MDAGMDNHIQIGAVAEQLATALGTHGAREHLLTQFRSGSVSSVCARFVGLNPSAYCSTQYPDRADSFTLPTEFWGPEYWARAGETVITNDSRDHVIVRRGQMIAARQLTRSHLAQKFTFVADWIRGDFTYSTSFMQGSCPCTRRALGVHIPREDVDRMMYALGLSGAFKSVDIPTPVDPPRPSPIHSSIGTLEARGDTSSWRPVGSEFSSLTEAYIAASFERSVAHKKAEQALLRRMMDGTLIGQPLSYSYWHQEGAEGPFTDFPLEPGTKAIPVSFWEALERTQPERRSCDWISGDFAFKGATVIYDPLEVLSHWEGRAVGVRVRHASNSRDVVTTHDTSLPDERPTKRKPGPHPDPNWELAIQNVAALYRGRGLSIPLPHGKRASIERKLLEEIEALTGKEYSESTAKKYANQVLVEIGIVQD